MTRKSPASSSSATSCPPLRGLFLAFTSIFFLFGMAHSETGKEKPVLYFSGIYGVSKDMPIYRKCRASLLQKARISLEKLSLDSKIPFTLEFSTDAEKGKKRLNDPLALSLVVTRDDEQVKEYSTPCCGKFHRSDLNLGIDVVVYQKMQEEGKTKNVVLFSIPVNKYQTLLDTSKTRKDGDLEGRMLRLFDSSMVSIVSWLKNMDVEKVHANLEIVGRKVKLDKGASNGLRVGQLAEIKCGDVKFKSRIADVSAKESSLRATASEFGSKVCSAEIYQLKMFDSDVWQVRHSEISSAGAKKMFDENCLSAQISTWATDALVHRGFCVLPTAQGNQWIVNSDRTLSMLLAHEGGNEEFCYPSPTKLIDVDFSGIARDVIDGNAIHEQVGYKIWLSWRMNGVAQPETSFVSAVNVVKGMEVVRDEDQFIDLLHENVQNLFGKGL